MEISLAYATIKDVRLQQAVSTEVLYVCWRKQCQEKLKTYVGSEVFD